MPVTQYKQQINFIWIFFFCHHKFIKNYRFSSHKAIYCPDLFLTPTEQTQNISAPPHKYQNNEVSEDYQQDLQKC